MRWGFVAYTDDWPAVIEQISKAEPHLRSIGRPVAADRLLVAYREFRNDLTRLGTTTAIAGTVTLRAVERDTRVRDRGGAGTGRLNRALVVRDLGPETGGMLPGAVGIADLELLDTQVRWWRTNEEGSSARVGGRIFGFFFEPGEEAPHGQAFREHALFQSGPSPVSGLGIIERPIPARWFVKKGAEAINAEWRQEFLAIRARFETRLDDVAHTYR